METMKIYLHSFRYSRFKYKNSCIRTIFDPSNQCLQPNPCIFMQKHFKSACHSTMCHLCYRNLKFVKDTSLRAKLFGWTYKILDNEIDALSLETGGMN
jgi:hypothetical protein